MAGDSGTVLYVEAMFEGMEDFEPLGIMTHRELMLWAIRNDMEGVYRMTELFPLQIDNGPV